MKHYYKKILIAFFSSLQFSFLNAQWVTIPDPNLASWLNTHGYSLCVSGNMLDTVCAANAGSGTIYLQYTNIQNFDGIQYFKKWKALHCDDNNLLSNIPALPPELTYLDCSSCTSLTALPNLPDSLRNLVCGYCSLTSLPNLPDSLFTLGCNGNQISNLPSLPNAMQILSCSDNPISNLPVLPDSLRHLYAQYCQLTGLPILPPLLEDLWCYQNQIDTIIAFPNNLREIICWGNLMSTLPSLPDSLINLSCGGSQLFTSLPPFPSKLERMLCQQGSLTSLPPLPNSLEELYCDGNQITSLPALPNSLYHLSCAANQITVIPPIPNSVYELYCSDNLLSSLPELPNYLQYLHIGDNPMLTCLPELKQIGTLNFLNTGIQCLPNYGNVTNSTPLLSSLPLCDLFNINGCAAFWNISGKVYNDSNSNCIPDFNELRMPNLKLLLDSAGTVIQQTFTVGEGLYSFDTDTGIYTYTIDTIDLPVMVTCPASGFQTSVLSVLDSMDYDMDFGMQCKPGFDVGAISVARDSGRFRPANFAKVRISAGDISNFFGLHCAAGISGSVQVVFAGDASYIGASAGSLTPVVSGDTLLYSIADFGTVNFNSGFSFVMQTDTTAAIGSQICFDVNVTPTAGDINPVNNSLQQCFTIVNSVDPNTKEVFPEGNIDTSQHWLTYTINFQNTGTAPAQHIYILDTLDNNLDESSFTLLSYNHQPLTQVIGKVIRFNFPNINLPDSTNDEPNSHGYVQFKVKIKTGLTNGTLIHNTANIYFDFNQPVTTNTTENEILITTGIEGFKVSGLRFKVVPNPAHSEINILFSSNDNFEIEILNTLGERIIKVKNKNSIDISKLANGIYFIKVFSRNTMVTGKFIKQ